MNNFNHVYGEMCQNSHFPTTTDHSATLLDNIITNITGYCIKSGVLYNDISDHFPVFNLLQINSKITKKSMHTSLGE